MRRKKDLPREGTIRTLADVLAAAGERPPDAASTKEESRKLAEDKRAYSTRFADRMATGVANGLRPAFSGILPDATGKGTESPAQSVRGPKKLDVNYSTPQLGLGVGVSLKAVHFPDSGKRRGYTHNTKRIDEEFRGEASGYHQRQPYSVMVGVVFLPEEACADATARTPSSFGRFVEYFRPLAGRHDAHDDIDRFERVFICLYARDGSRMEFFDVEVAPPRRGRPRVMLAYREFLDEVELSYVRRNSAEFEWADDQSVETDEPPPDDEAESI